MAVTCTRKFNWATADGGAQIYFPGQVIEDQDAAAFAKMTGYGEERAEQAPARALRSPEDKAATLERTAGENKGGKNKKRDQAAEA